MNTIITIGREFGSGGHMIGKRLAEKLNIPFYDKELLDRAAKESGFCKEIFENQDERPTNSFLYSLVMDTYSNNVMTDLPLNQKVFLAQFESIKKLANEGPCVIIGRCADYALEEDPRLLSVFIHADPDIRIRRISKIYNITAGKAKDRIRKNDKSRASYYNYYTSKEWGAVDSYMVSIDSGIFGVDGSVDLLVKAIERRESQERVAITDIDWV